MTDTICINSFYATGIFFWECHLDERHDGALFHLLYRFAVILVLCAVSMATEWLHLPEVTTGQDADTLYDLLPQVQSLPCSRLYLLVFLSIAAVLKFQSVSVRVCACVCRSIVALV